VPANLSLDSLSPAPTRFRARTHWYRFVFFLIAGIIPKRTQSRSVRWCVWGLAALSIFLIGLSQI
jgi:hypothetical protein